MKEELEIQALEAQLKEAKRKLKEKNKPKTITISSSDHDLIKKHCSIFGLNIGEWTSNVLKREIEESSCLIKEDFDEEVEKSKILSKYSTGDNYPRYKSSKYIMSTQYEFVGYSKIDSLPIYKFIGKEIPSPEVLIEKELVLKKLVQVGKEISMTIEPTDLDIVCLD